MNCVEYCVKMPSRHTMQEKQSDQIRRSWWLYTAHFFFYNCDVPFSMANFKPMYTSLTYECRNGNSILLYVYILLLLLCMRLSVCSKTFEMHPFEREIRTSTSTLYQTENSMCKTKGTRSYSSISVQFVQFDSKIISGGCTHFRIYCQ